MSVAVKRVYHCGWIDRATWRECQLPPSIGIPDYVVQVKEHGVCPGWLVRQPVIVDCCAAYAAFQKGQLESVFPHAEAYLVEGAMLLSSIMNQYENARLKSPPKG